MTLKNKNTYATTDRYATSKLTRGKSPKSKVTSMQGFKMVKRSKKKKKETATQIRENHISYITRRDPRRFRILAFAQAVAARKIQARWRYYNYNKECKVIER